jgi:hypothetical protein
MWRGVALSTNEEDGTALGYRHIKSRKKQLLLATAKGIVRMDLMGRRSPLLTMPIGSRSTREEAGGVRVARGQMH